MPMLDLNASQSDELEEEEIEEMAEEEYLKYVDAQINPLDGCAKLFKPQTLSSASFLTKAQVESLRTNGYFVVDNYVDKATVEQLYAETVSLFDATPSAFLKAHSDADSKEHGFDLAARDDYVCWLHRSKQPLSECQERIVKIFAALKADLSFYIKFSCHNSFNEIQLAIYPSNCKAKYVKHRDAFPLDNYNEQIDSPRRITCIIYTGNASSGNLRVVHPRSLQSESIETLPGRLVVFVSGAVDHEVEAVGNCPRVAVSCWMH